MLILLSPAKTLDFDPTERDLPATKPALHAEAKKLAGVARELSLTQIQQLMELSDSLAETAHGYLQNWKSKWDAKGAKQAILAFRGDVYQGFNADTLTDSQLEKAQQHVRILSGLYGLLRPLDPIQPYRLEMGRKLANPRGNNLYDWWGDRVTETIRTDLETLTKNADRLVVNLASKEYSAVVDFKQLDARVVTPVFKERHKQGWRTVSFYAKLARGAMARHLVRTRAGGERAIRSFDADGYRYNPELSEANSPVFSRESA